MGWFPSKQLKWHECSILTEGKTPAVHGTTSASLLLFVTYRNTGSQQIQLRQWHTYDLQRLWLIKRKKGGHTPFKRVKYRRKGQLNGEDANESAPAPLTPTPSLLAPPPLNKTAGQSGSGTLLPKRVQYKTRRVTSRHEFCVFTHVASIYANLLEQKKAFT